MDIGRITFFHPDGRTAAPNITGSRQQLLEVNHLHVFIAGGFGFYLNKESAIKVGLIPKEFKDKIKAAGNTAGLGAVMCAADCARLIEAEKLCGECSVTDLASNPLFTELFMDNMFFGDCDD